MLLVGLGAVRRQQILLQSMLYVKHLEAEFCCWEAKFSEQHGRCSRPCCAVLCLCKAMSLMQYT